MNSILKTLGVFLVLAVIFPLIALAEEKQEPTNILAGPITLAQALQMALLQNPGLQAFSYEVRAREAQALQAGLVSNPRLNVEVENVGGSGNFNNFDHFFCG